MRHLRWVLALGLVPVGAVAQTVHYEGGVSATTGRYLFPERTTSIAWNTGLSLTAGAVTLRASVPVWWQNTPLLTASGIGQLPSGGGGEGSRAVSDSAMARRQRGGTGATGRGSGMSPAWALGPAPVPIEVTQRFQTALGDPMLSGTVRLGAGRTRLTLGLAAKVPIADTTTFGTGRWDVGASASLSFQPIARTLIGVDLAYWHLGDLAELDFRDPVTGGVSVSRLFGSSWGGMLTATMASSPIEGFDGPAALGAGLTRFAGRSAWGVMVGIGLTATSPEVSGGVTWRLAVR